MTDLLAKLIESPLGFSSFRPYQEDVCRAVIEQKDCLLVMPTGAGKSLCYQLPGLVLKGTTLVISPLVALMEDQVAKMQAKGLRAERIHAGRDRAASRQVCFDYLEGKLDYLYIAPERLGVPNFPEMLAKRKPAVIAVDEAHCISQWGHDFRPDYRRLRDRLALLRPSPILAVTATATKVVQDDIVKQLDLTKARRFIHGFTRTNIGIEVVEMTASLREETVLQLLLDKDKRPAIVYAPTRKTADSLGLLLRSHCSAEAYHAGLPPSERDRIQKAFLEGDLDIIVATIAFGMGIDKANVRTVLHTAMPGSVEAYYQEIGRAGRDGKLSRAVLLQSYADRRTHEFFLDRDYPEDSVLKKIYDSTGAKPVAKETLMKKVGLEEETFARALEKLWIHKGVEIDFAENVQRGVPGWQKTYLAQREHKSFQLQQVADFINAKGCRMGHLVRHFGEEQSSPCGLCDFCAEAKCLVKAFREATDEEVQGLHEVFALLTERDGLSMGQLHQRTADTHRLERRAFEDLMEGLARSGNVSLMSDSFEKDGKSIRYQRVYLTAKVKKQGAFTTDDLSISRTMGSASQTKKTAKRRSQKKQTSTGPLQGTAREVFQRLRDWRLNEAQKWKVPAFCVLSDRVMRTIAESLPKTEDELLKIHGFGPKLLEKHGHQILSTLQEFDA